MSNHVRILGIAQGPSTSTSGRMNRASKFLRPNFVRAHLFKQSDATAPNPTSATITAAVVKSTEWYPGGALNPHSAAVV